MSGLGVVVVGDLLPGGSVALSGKRRVAVEVADVAGFDVAVLPRADQRARAEADAVRHLVGHVVPSVPAGLAGVVVVGDLLPGGGVDLAWKRRVAVEVADLTGLDVAVLPGTHERAGGEADTLLGHRETPRCVGRADNVQSSPGFVERWPALPAGPGPRRPPRAQSVSRGHRGRSPRGPSRSSRAPSPGPAGRRRPAHPRPGPASPPGSLDAPASGRNRRRWRRPGRL